MPLQNRGSSGSASVQQIYKFGRFILFNHKHIVQNTFQLFRFAEIDVINVLLTRISN